MASRLLRPTILTDDLPFGLRIVGAGISDNSTTPRTEWPLTGGSLNVTLHDAAAYIFINLGFGVNTSDFNVTLFSAPLNETGPGNLCFPKLTLPPGLPIQEGTQASIQFATAGHNGEGLYNCADITFTNNATLLPADQCQNSSTVSVTTLGSSSSPASNSSSASSSASSSTTASSSSAAELFAPSALMVLLASLFVVAW
ncbi:uncharacterized protein Z520_00758 [Fonsecaea multimorphosa CBS 102226]|uniref:Copper acquisition factor BIM1-like domain-containing protein n=1 Tax=Fonsecaea multimorphosa CBS 102226 TaxID=1442371 RepID=A0A0D2HQB1_9EURO|nr:uncharacterized protein Z520_00758 [Fonsecaea multimorphosa CBS 102226]KIY04066.1 hypothetical protein Z520_00758 [Fonsecaea multimorphosa CBS 102226]OAL31900.1 hypothetical protein AYO22_00770 [Fonsecaea multimorphosa]